MEVISTIGLITINETLIIQLFSFLIFVFIINRIMFRPLKSVMGERDDYILKIKMDIVDAEKELKTIEDKMIANEAAIKKEAFVLKEELEKSGNRKAAEIFDSIRQEIETIKSETEREVETQISEARKYIKNESEFLAVNIMEKLVDRRLVQ